MKWFKKDSELLSREQLKALVDRDVSETQQQIEKIRERVIRRKAAFEDGAVIKRQLGNIIPAERDARVAEVLGWILGEIDEVTK